VIAMPEHLDVNPMQPHLQEAARKASQGGTFQGVVDGADLVCNVVEVAAVSVDVAGTVFETVGSAAEVSGHVLSGAFDALGSVGELAGCLDGCSGCSAAIIFAVVLGAAGAAVAGTIL
jgi:hypothetical protein